jgi:small subunit ribosomal protein S18
MRPSSRPTADKKPASAFGNRKNFSRSKKSCPFTGENAPAIDHKNVRLLQRFITDHGKIMPKRITGVSAKNQRLSVHGFWRCCPMLTGSRLLPLGNFGFAP